MTCENSLASDGRRYERFLTFRGIRQGSVLSSVLFPVVVDEVIRKEQKDQVDYQNLWYMQMA
jgi:hypothetical protein